MPHPVEKNTLFSAGTSMKRSAPFHAMYMVYTINNL
jgi:hypothetical protein